MILKLNKFHMWFSFYRVISLVHIYKFISMLNIRASWPCQTCGIYCGKGPPESSLSENRPTSLHTLSESIVVSAWIEMDTLNHKQKDNQLLIYIDTILVIKSSPFKPYIAI